MTLHRSAPRPARTLPALLAVSLLLGAAACGNAQSSGGANSSSPASAPASAGTRIVTDMAGRQVEVPAQITKVATLGSVPVINSFLFALGKGDLIVNGLPKFAANPRWKYQYVFAPQIEGQPVLQGADNAPLTEQIVKANPDVVLTMMPAHAAQLEKMGIKTIVLRWQNDEDVKKVVTLLGEVLGVPDRANEYTTTFDAIVKEVGDAVGDVPADKKVTALSLDPKNMGQPHTIAQWWISKAGGKPVTEGNTEESLKFNAEQVVTWNPQMIFVNDPDSIAMTTGDVRLAPVAAVKDKKVYNVPIAAHTWGNRTSEQPLTVAFAASKMYPDKMTQEHLTQITKRFYKEAFHADLTDAQIQEILKGM